jgi:phosphoribosyl 1,2-cyclic phosphodiesterase
MQVTCWGVRGSIPTPGPHTRRWGGNSSCVEIRHGALSPLVLDCGTGARELGRHLVGQPHRALDLVFSHFHMDHVFGFPFFAPLYAPGFEVRVSVPAYSVDDARSKMARYLNGVYHPTRLRDLPSDVTFRAIRSGRAFDASGFTLHPLSLNHPGGALGYRVEVDGQRVAYVTDTAPFARPQEGVAVGADPTKAERRVIELLEACDLVLYDTMYSHDEYLTKMSWGHSYPEYAVSLCRAANVRKLLLFHHLPDATDEDLDALAEHWSGHVGPEVRVAREGEVLSVT